jgi:hypothetical protein
MRINWHIGLPGPFSVSGPVVPKIKPPRKRPTTPRQNHPSRSRPVTHRPEVPRQRPTGEPAAEPTTPMFLNVAWIVLTAVTAVLALILLLS